MAAQVVVLLGPARSGKTHELLRQFRAVRNTGSPENLEPALWLAPNGRTAVTIRDQLIRDGQTACLRPGLMTFENFTDEVLIASSQRLKTLDSFQQRELIRHVLRQALEHDSLQLFAMAAERPGFIGLVAGHLTELKRRNIRPDPYSRAASRGAISPEQIELARIYADYESLLTKHGLVDREGAHQAACDSLANNTCRRFRNLKLVIADGFTDFTSTQHEIFRLLSERVQQLFISLPFISDSPRSDLFAKVAATLRDLQQNYPQLEARTFDHRTLPDPRIDHIAQYVFSNPKQIPTLAIDSPDSSRQIEIIAAASAQDEITQVARRIKSLLVDPPSGSPYPARPDDILVVARSLTNLEPRIREVFERFGIPHFLEARPAVVTAPAIKILLDLLQLDQDDWPFRHVISILTNHCLTAFTDSARRSADWLVRDLQIASGGTSLLDRIRSLAEDTTPTTDRSPHLARRVEAAKQAQPALTLRSLHGAKPSAISASRSALFRLSQTRGTQPTPRPINPTRPRGDPSKPRSPPSNASTPGSNCRRDASIVPNCCRLFVTSRPTPPFLFRITKRVGSAFSPLPPREIFRPNIYFSSA